MNEKIIVSKVNEYLHEATRELCLWLDDMLPRVTDNWWQECVLNNLSYAQRNFCEENNYNKLEQFDLAALLRITDKSWYSMRSFAYLPTSQRECVRSMVKVRNNWAHCAGEIPEKKTILDDLYTIREFFDTVISTTKYSRGIDDLIAAVDNADFSAVYAEQQSVVQVKPQKKPVEGEIKERDMVYLTGSPDVTGMVFSVTDVNGVKKYDVFVEGAIKTFYDGQIALVASCNSTRWIDLNTFTSNLTAYEINNPSAGNLYSLNAARIDFVPYQFRPALKLIKADEPRILIADSVGVGKTIEAGLIIKELEARNELDNILIICPKPLVAERKWELEMKRYV